MRLEAGVTRLDSDGSSQPTGSINPLDKGTTNSPAPTVNPDVPLTEQQGNSSSFLPRVSLLGIQLSECDLIEDDAGNIELRADELSRIRLDRDRDLSYFLQIIWPATTRPPNQGRILRNASASGIYPSSQLMPVSFALRSLQSPEVGFLLLTNLSYQNFFPDSLTQRCEPSIVSIPFEDHYACLVVESANPCGTQGVHTGNGISGDQLNLIQHQTTNPQVAVAGDGGGWGCSLQSQAQSSGISYWLLLLLVGICLWEIKYRKQLKA